MAGWMGGWLVGWVGWVGGWVRGEMHGMGAGVGGVHRQVGEPVHLCRVARRGPSERGGEGLRRRAGSRHCTFFQGSVTLLAGLYE